MIDSGIMEYVYYNKDVTETEHKEVFEYLFYHYDMDSSYDVFFEDILMCGVFDCV